MNLDEFKEFIKKALGLILLIGLLILSAFFIYQNFLKFQNETTTFEISYEDSNVIEFPTMTLCFGPGYKPAVLNKVWSIKKVSKLGRKFYLTKSCSIWFKLWQFLDKVSGKNILKF